LFAALLIHIKRTKRIENIIKALIKEL